MKYGKRTAMQEMLSMQQCRPIDRRIIQNLSHPSLEGVGLQRRVQRVRRFRGVLTEGKWVEKRGTVTPRRDFHSVYHKIPLYTGVSAPFSSRSLRAGAPTRAPTRTQATREARKEGTEARLYPTLITYRVQAETCISNVNFRLILK